MDNQPLEKSLTEKIIDEMIVLLQADQQFDAAIIEKLQRLASSGRIKKHTEVCSTLTETTNENIRT